MRFSTNTEQLALASDGTVYIADTDFHAIRLLTTTGEVVTLVGGGNANHGNTNDGFNSTFARPQGIAVDKAGVVYVSELGDNTPPADYQIGRAHV